MTAQRTMYLFVICMFMLLGMTWLVPQISRADTPRRILPISRTSDGLMSADVMVNDQGPFRMIVDTAAATSSLRRSVLPVIGLMHNDREWRVHGLIGVEKAPVVEVDMMRAGTFSTSGALIILDDKQAISDPTVRGILGADLLASNAREHRYLVMDFHDDNLRSGRSLNRIGLPSSVNWTKMTQTGRDQEFLTFDMKIGETKVIAIIDTGLTFAVANRALAAAMEKSGRSVQTRPYVDANGEEASLNLMNLPGINGAGMRWGPSTVLVHDSPAIELLEVDDVPVLLLGLHHLKETTVVIDRRSRSLAFGIRGQFVRNDACTGSRVNCPGFLKSVVTK